MPHGPTDYGVRFWTLPYAGLVRLRTFIRQAIWVPSTPRDTRVCMFRPAFPGDVLDEERPGGG